ncbi:MAG: C25 family cysteine peptidase [bacterium]
MATANQAVQVSDGPTSVRLLDQDHSGLTMELQIGEVQLNEVVTKEGTFTMLSTAGAGPSNRYGDPALPVISKLIQVPLGCNIKAQAMAGEVVEIDLNTLAMANLVLPAQPSISKSEDPDLVPFVFNNSTYQMTGYFNVPLVEVEEAGIMRAVRLATIHIAPFEYSPSEHKIRVFKNITVQITYENADWAATEERYQRLYSPVFETVYEQVFNYEAPVSGDRLDLETYPIGYLIVSDRQFEAQLAPFIAWKTQKGFYVTDVYLDEIGSNQNTVAAWIETFFDTAAVAPSYLLIVADDNQLQAFSGTAGSHITDLYFCEFTNDHIPDMYYGRFSGTTPAHIQPQIDKTMEYEQLLMDPAFLGEVTLVSGVDGGYAPTYGNGQINYGTNLYFDAAHGITPNVWLYPASDGSGAGTAIINTINDGVSFYNYTAHGSHDGLADPAFTTSNLPSLTNYHRYVNIVGNCCLTNTFGDDYTTPCFGEALLRLDSTGGIAYIGASNSTYWDEDYWWGVGYGPVVAAGPTYEQTTMGAYDGTFHDHGEPMSEWYVTNGAMVVAGNMGVQASTSSRKTYYWEAYHLMGDPSCMTYMGVPTENTIYHDPTMLLTATDFTVSADPGSYVGITFGGELQGAGYVGASGSVVVPLVGFASPGEATVTVTCQNREPYVATVMVIAPNGPYVVFDYYDIDDAAGNGNGMVDFGESIVLGLGLKNVGPDDAVDIAATITTIDSFVTITDGTEAYGTILGDNGTGYSASGFAFDVAGNIPDGHRITFDLEVTGTARETGPAASLWTLTLRLSVS